MIKILVLTLLLIIVCSCKKDKIEGIIIGHDLLELQSYSENKKLDSIIKMALKGDHNSLKMLNNFPCNGGSTCYEKGYIITQIIYKMGEKKFTNLVKKLDKKEFFDMKGYISIGLEYGDNDYNGTIDNKKGEIEFPTLMMELEKR